MSAGRLALVNSQRLCQHSW